LVVLKEHPSLRRFLCYGMLYSASGAIFLTYLARYLVEVFIGEDLITLWQGLAQIPFMLLGIWLAGWLLPRVGGARLLGLFTLLLMLAQAGFLVLSPQNSAWLLPVLFAAWGLSRSSQRLVAFGRMQEVIEVGDARQPSLYFGALGLGAIIGSLVVMLLVPVLQQARSEGGLLQPVSWYIMLGALAVGGLATVVALLPQPLYEPYDPEHEVKEG
jgi:Na+/melibiose symporter-like transporter